jgi:cyclic peptide transporter
MGLLSLLRQKSGFFYVALTLLGLSDSILNIGLLMFINTTISGGKMPAILQQAPLVIYIALLVISIISSALFQQYIIRLTNDLRFEMELKILEKLKKARYEKFENLGNEKVFTAMGDARELAYLPEVFMSSFNALVMVACCLGYLFVTSWIGALLVLGIMAVLLTVYLARNVAATKDLNKLRDLQDRYFVYLADLLYGYRELKMSGDKTKSIFDDFFYPNRREGKQLSNSAAIRYMSNELTGKYSWYIVLGIIMFLLPATFRLQSAGLLSFVTTILYLIGPIAVLITLVPTYTRVKIAVTRLHRYEEQIQQSLGGDETDEPDEEIAGTVTRIKFDDVSYEYVDAERNNRFSLGPVNLEFTEGELVFITGGNGSGKSTFVNLLTGLYQPIHGKISLQTDDAEVIMGDSALYREHMAAIFTNPHLFNENYYNIELGDSNLLFSELIGLMKLEGIVEVDKKKNIINTNLSKGQQKRVAMIYALMESKPVLVLDEWAAEQDPEFRRYFYRHLLPELQRQGKIIIAITHDDAYFQYADRVIKFDYGRITSITANESVLTGINRT